MMAKHKKTAFQPSSTKAFTSSTAKAILPEHARFVPWAANLLISTADPKVLDKIFRILSVAKQLMTCIVVSLYVFIMPVPHTQ